MSLKNKRQLIEKIQYELTFEVERSVFDAAVEKVYRRQAKNITIPGFRRGKAPRSIIEKMYGKGVFYEHRVVCSAIFLRGSGLRVDSVR